MKIHHVGYLVKDIYASRQKFLLLGFETETESRYDEIRDIYIQFLKNGSYRVELVQPASESSSFYSAMKRFKNLPYHICYEVRNIDDAMMELQKKGFKISQPPEKAPCIGDNKVAFAQSPEMGIIELLEMEE